MSRVDLQMTKHLHNRILAFMLLSPNMAKMWTPRIRRIILDEIHTLGTQPGGVWEQILLLARCPIIGLSATVGDAEDFNKARVILLCCGRL